MASHQYNLRSDKSWPTRSRSTRPSGPARPAELPKPNLKRKRVDNHEPSKPDQPDTQTPSGPNPTATSLGSLPAGTRLLFQKPQKWTLDHLRATNIKREMDVPLERIVPAKHIPSHDDPGKSASALQQDF